jgi:nucleotide-binding universal stress UspA family protein
MKEKTTMYKKILIATDGTTLSKKAVTHGLDLAKAIGASVVAFYAVPHYPTAYFEGAVVWEPSQIAEFEQDWTRQGQKYLDAIRAEGQEKGVTVHDALIKSDTAAEAIIQAAKHHKCDLIVMASHGRKAIKRMLLGSETLTVLTHSHIPVLVLR